MTSRVPEPRDLWKQAAPMAPSTSKREGAPTIMTITATTAVLPKWCNHTSVGVLAEQAGRFLLIERGRYPFAKAPAAGHVDELPGLPSGSDVEAAVYAECARRELEEETGLRAGGLELVLTATTGNRCRRRPLGGDEHWHAWRIYRTVIDPGRQPHGAAGETSDPRWYTPAELEALAARTRRYRRGEVTQAEWLRRTGLDPVWIGFLAELGIVPKGLAR